MLTVQTVPWRPENRKQFARRLDLFLCHPCSNRFLRGQNLHSAETNSKELASLALT